MQLVEINNMSWHLKYVGLPLALATVLYKVICGITLRRRRSKLRGKVVLITGASSGIGEAMAHVFHSLGSKVVLAARRETELNRVKQDLMSKILEPPSPEPLVLKLDLADIESLDLCVSQVYEQCGAIDILVNNGGVSHRGAILDTKPEVHKNLMDINYLGPVFLTKAVLPNMVRAKRGHIVFISSVQGLIAIPDRSGYAAAKHATQAFADSLRAEMHQHNLHVSVVSPGYIRTSMSLNALTASGDHHGKMDETTAAGFTPEYTAEKIVDMIANKDKELVISQFMPKFGIFARRNIPSLYFYIMAKRAKKTNI